MKKLLTIYLCLAVIALVMPLWAWAAPANHASWQGLCENVVISSPRTGASPVRGRVNISGSASLPNFDYYKVEFAPEPVPPQGGTWRLVGADLHRTPVINGVLETWDTTLVPDGSYSLRLRVVDKTGNYPCPDSIAGQIVVANTQPTPTVTPTVTPTPTETPSVPTIPTAILVPPTIVVPTAPPPPTVAPVARPAVTPQSDSLFSINFAGLGRALIRGMVAMGSIILFIAIFSLGRWVRDQFM
ncbi:MAG: hypothetical protein ACE5NP_08140 [Anaerolineae bacterium]